MQEKAINLTTQQKVSVMMAISNQMNSNRNIRLSLATSGESKERLEILDSEIQSLAEAYKAIQETL